MRRRYNFSPADRAASFTAERVELFDAMLRARGVTLTKWLNEELDKWLGENHDY